MQPPSDSDEKKLVLVAPHENQNSLRTVDFSKVGSRPLAPYGGVRGTSLSFNF